MAHLRLRLLWAVALVLSLSLRVSATLTLPAVIGSHMVLQRGGSAIIWGWSSTPVSRVSLFLDGGLVQSQLAGLDGSWAFDLGDRPASSGHTLVLTDDDDKVALEDVAFGDVILCSGQSNMEMSMSAALNASAEIADSVHYPLLRMFTSQKVAAWTPQQNVVSKTSSFNWAVSRPQAFQGGAWGVFSATCYLTGRDLYRALSGAVPVGLVASTWGGTKIEAWSSKDALDKCATVTADNSSELEWEEEEDSELDKDPALTAGVTATSFSSLSDPDPDPAPPRNADTVLWNGMIAPLLPMRFKMVLWYQAETNRNKPAPYACKFPAMIEDWRRKFRQPLPFIFVQIAAYPEGGANWPILQVAQTAALRLDGVGFASAMDLGDPASPEGSIHPRDKQTLGARLVRSILAVVYGRKLVHTGPQVASLRMDGGADAKAVTIALVDDASGQGLHLRGTENCNYNMTGGCCEEIPFMLGQRAQGGDGGGVKAYGRSLQLELASGTNAGTWIRATSVKVGASSVVVGVDSLPAGTRITHINYSFQPYAQCCLYNSEGLPMTVFQSATSAATGSTGSQLGAHRKQRIVLVEN